MIHVNGQTDTRKVASTFCDYANVTKNEAAIVSVLQKYYTDQILKWFNTMYTLYCAFYKYHVITCLIFTQNMEINHSNFKTLF